MPSATAQRPTVAVIDDDIRFIRLVERILRTEGVEISPITTLDLDEVVRVVTETGCQTALVDVFMYGEASGFELVRRLREHEATCRMSIVVTSGARREIGHHVAFLQQHKCSILLKPFELDDLLVKLGLSGSPLPVTTVEREAMVVPKLGPSAIVPQPVR